MIISALFITWTLRNHAHLDIDGIAQILFFFKKITKHRMSEKEVGIDVWWFHLALFYILLCADYTLTVNEIYNFIQLYIKKIDSGSICYFNIFLVLFHVHTQDLRIVKSVQCLPSLTNHTVTETNLTVMFTSLVRSKRSKVKGIVYLESEGKRWSGKKISIPHSICLLLLCRC